MNSGKRDGFTLIELIIVIVILGILAATLAPKFVNLQKDAKISVVKALSGSIKTAMQVVRAKWLMLDNQSIDNVTLEDGSIVKVYAYGNPSTSSRYTTVYGYPELSSDGLPKALDYDDKKFSVDGNGRSIRFYYSGTVKNRVNTNEDTGCGVYCRLESVTINGSSKYKIACYTNTGECN